MKENLKLLIFLTFIYLSLSIVPLWHIEKSAINLFPNDPFYIDYITDETIHDNFNYKLQKIITKNNDEIEISNYVIFNYNNDDKNISVPFEEIESAYTDKDHRYFICPKGRNHPYYINTQEEKGLQPLIPEGFEDNGEDWELNCFLKYVENSYKKLFFFYLNKQEYIYSVNNINSNNIVRIGDTKFKIFGFRWPDSSSNEHPMYAITVNQNYVNIEKILFNIDPSKEVSTTIIQRDSNSLFEIPKSNIKAFLNEDQDHSKFFFVSYDNNDTNITIGYTIDYGKIDNYNKFDVITNLESPLQFFDKMKLESIDFIPYTQYLYYKLFNEDKNKYYYGIIDIEYNKVIYNTDEPMTKFIPYSKSSMLAITSSSAYKICIKYEDGKCVESCNYNNVYYDVDNYNYCSDSYSCDHYLLWPNEICVDECDQNLFYLDNQNYCSLCKDYSGLNKPYKMINTHDCLEEKIDNSYFVNEEFLIISCKDNYTYTNGQCEFNCYSSCETCLEKSINDTDQKCITCKTSFPFLYNSNCLDVCPNKTYENNYKCIDCDESCLSCDITGCKNCYEGFYVNNDSHICEKCHENCETCYNGGNDMNNNCIKCKNENDTLVDGTCLKNCGEKQYRSLYNTCEQCHENCSTCLIGGDDKNNNCSSCINDLYLIKGGEYENNCVESCPENYSKNDTEKICTYVKPSDNTDSPDSSDESDSWLWYVITITAILLLIINIIFFSKNCCYKDKEDIVENIQTELSDMSGNNMAINS